MTSTQRKISNVKLCYLNASDISLKSASGVFFLPACDEMGDTGRSPNITTSSRFLLPLGKLFDSIQETHMSYLLRLSLGSALSYCSPKEKPAKLTVLSLRTHISHRVLAPNFHSKATNGSLHS